MQGKYIGIPQLGIERYFLSNDRCMGGGTCQRNQEYLGVGCIDDDHYLVNLNNLMNSPNSKDDHIVPEIAFRLLDIGDNGRAEVLEIKDIGILEMIAAQVNDVGFMSID